MLSLISLLPLISLLSISTFDWIMLLIIDAIHTLNSALFLIVISSLLLSHGVILLLRVDETLTLRFGLIIIDITIFPSFPFLLHGNDITLSFLISSTWETTEPLAVLFLLGACGDVFLCLSLHVLLLFLICLVIVGTIDVLSIHILILFYLNVRIRYNNNS